MLSFAQRSSSMFIATLHPAHTLCIESCAGFQIEKQKGLREGGAQTHNLNFRCMNASKEDTSSMHLPQRWNMATLTVGGKVVTYAKRKLPKN